MVTPPYKAGFEIGFDAFSGSISEDGSALIGESVGAFADAENVFGIGDIYQFSRTASGWITTPLKPSAASHPFVKYLDRSTVDGSTLWSDEAAEATHQLLYIRRSDGVLVDVGPMDPPSENPTQEGGSYAGATPDFSHVFFSSNGESAGGRWPFDETQGLEPSLFEYSGVESSKPTFVGVSGVAGSHALISQCGTSLGSAKSHDTYNAISTSGATVFFTAEHEGGCVGAQPVVNELYVRIGAQKTLAISEPTLPPGEECTAACASAAHGEGIFQGASQNGSKVFFLTEQPLLNGDTDSTMDLYEAEIEGEGQSAKVGKLIQVSHDPNAGQPAEVQGVARVSEDGSHVYFVAKGVLASEHNGLDDAAVLNQDNLYVYDTATQRVAFVATLSSSDEGDWSAFDVRPVQATPDGRFLLFGSVADLTGDASGETPQIYRYDASNGELVRVSIGQCPPPATSCASAERFNHDGATGRIRLTERAYLERDEATPHGALDISNDGSYVFFESKDGLTPQAQNEEVIAEILENPNFEKEGEEPRYEPIIASNVYEYHDGNVYLVSSGQDRNVINGSAAVHFEGTDASGADAFFVTTNPLSLTDTDPGADLYDARIDGGFPAPVAVPSCRGDSCQGSTPPPPAEPTPASSSFSGPGNVAAVPPTSAKSVTPKKKAAAQIKAEKLAKALKACKSKAKSRRKSCEASARTRYGPKSVTKAKKSNRRGK